MNLINADGLEVMDRNHIQALLRENHLISQGIIDESIVKKGVAFFKIDGWVEGKINNFGDRFKIQLKIINVNTSQVFAVSMSGLINRAELKKLVEPKSCNNCQGTGTIKAYASCNECEGKGGRKCFSCDGSGVNMIAAGLGSSSAPCESCRGKGKIVCQACHGKGNCFIQYLWHLPRYRKTAVRCFENKKQSNNRRLSAVTCVSNIRDPVKLMWSMCCISIDHTISQGGITVYVKD